MNGGSAHPRDDDALFKVRPYALVGGRTRAQIDIAIETLVLATELGSAQFAKLPLGYREVLSLAESPLSVAEIAAQSGTAIGATKVLVADLITEELLSCSEPSGELPDIEIMRRVVDGLNAI